MKKLMKIISLVLAICLALGALVGCGCEHADENLDEFCDECSEFLGVKGASVSAEEWKSAFTMTNVKMNVTEVYYFASNGQKAQETKVEYYGVDGVFYDKDGIDKGEAESFFAYFPFGESYDSFSFSEEKGIYSCYSVYVSGRTYTNSSVKFGENKKISEIKFEVHDIYYGYYNAIITVKFSDYGSTEKPEREPFVFEGEEASRYATERDIDGRKIAYVTMTVKGYGDIKLLLDATTAPITVMNFLELAKSGFYDGLTFHRVIDNFMIQGGDPKANGTGGNTDEDGNEINIKGEFSKNGHENDIGHIRGVISMARSSDYDSASSQFFICNSDSASVKALDGSYAAFGYVIDGMSVVDRITYDTMIYDGDGDGGIYDKSKQAVIEKIVIDELVGITLGTVGGNPNELPVDPAP